MLKTNKQALLFNFGEDLSYLMILRYRLRDFIKIYDDFVNGLIKGDFQKTTISEDYYFRSAGKVWWKYKWLWLHTTRKRFLGLSFMINNQTV